MMGSLGGTLGPMYESLTSGSSGPMQKVKKERKLSLILPRTAEPLASFVPAFFDHPYSYVEHLMHEDHIQTLKMTTAHEKWAFDAARLSTAREARIFGLSKCSRRHKSVSA